MSELSIRPLEPADWPEVERIYAEGIATGNATLETATPSWEVFDAAHHRFGRLVAVRNGEVVGWAALSPVSRRPVYGGVAEESVYVAPACQGRGVGLALLQALERESEAHGLWTLQGSILAENAASLALHARAGFRVVGRRERIARRQGVWRDTIIVERRSPVVG